MWKIRLGALALLIIGVALGYAIYYSEITPESFLGRFPFVLGLDLKGGSHLVYRADVSRVIPTEVESSMESLRGVIERRVNLFGVSEPLVQVERSGILSARQEERLIIELPGITDVKEAVTLIGATPTLEFKLLKPDVIPSSEQTLPPESFEDTGLTGRFLSRAQLQFDQTSAEPQVLLQFNDEGQKLFSSITETNVNRVLAIFLDGEVISTPIIREPITNGQAVIFGQFTPEEARTLVRDLNYGALPLPIELVSTQTIGASLGDEALQASVFAGVIGFILVAFFLILWYRLPGILATISLLMYVVIVLVIFKVIPVTLSAAGLAAFILSIGMAVDANVLIFERMKEELLLGKSLEVAIREGFARAWLSIRDSNLSSIITAVILFWLGGTAVIKGFALVLCIGVLASMFTAITMSRTLLLALGLGAKKHEGVVRFLFGKGLSL